MAVGESTTGRSAGEERRIGKRNPARDHQAAGEWKEPSAKNEIVQAQKEIYLMAPADMVIESITLKKGELALPGYTLFNGYQLAGTCFRFTIPESKINSYQVNQPLLVKVPFTQKTIRVTVASIKQLPRYADNTSAAPNYQLGEGLFEVKLLPVNTSEAEGLFANSTVLLEEK
jgi:HlyD family secretion protein